MDMDRGGFLRLGAGGLIAAATTGLAVPAAGAALPPPTPQDDDVAFLSFATAAESTSRDFYRAAFKQAGTGLTAAQRRHINRVASAKRAHIIRLKAALGADAPQSSDFVTVLPKGAVKTAARIAALGEQLAWLRAAAGHASPAGLLSPIDLEPAADALDAFLSTPDFPD